MPADAPGHAVPAHSKPHTESGPAIANPVEGENRALSTEDGLVLTAVVAQDGGFVRPKWQLGGTRLAPPMPARYEPPDMGMDAGSRLDRILDRKQKQMKGMEQELTFLSTRQTDAQTAFDEAMRAYLGIRSECEDIKKKKAHIRVFGAIDVDSLAKPKRKVGGVTAPLPMTAPSTQRKPGSDEDAQLDRTLAAKAGHLKTMEQQLATQMLLDESTAAHGLAMSELEEVRSECDEMKKRKARIRVFGSTGRISM